MLVHGAVKLLDLDQGRCDVARKFRQRLNGPILLELQPRVEGDAAAVHLLLQHVPELGQGLAELLVHAPSLGPGDDHSARFV